MVRGFDADEYQRRALASRNKRITDPDMMLLNAALGLAGEGGEVADHLKKVMFHDHAPDKEHIKKELGDILWYVALAAEAMGTTLSEIMEMNIVKLSKRYPGGFDPALSRGRTE
jgi:NTP pyrophosphatase (non-canonical NTP hydrolase)